MYGRGGIEYGYRGAREERGIMYGRGGIEYGNRGARGRASK
jgi:hypothetical protein